MKGVRFYLEYPDRHEKRKGTRHNLDTLGNHTGNVIAVFHENIIPQSYWNENGQEHYTFAYEAIAGLFEKPNSPVASTSVDADYLDENCKRISEEKAREIHPELFRILDNE